MKIRTGFVSNSSSASYTVIIDMELNEFIDIMFEEFGYSYFRVSDLILKYTDIRDKYKESLDEETSKKDKRFNCYTQENLDEIDLVIEKLKTIQDLDELQYSLNDNEEGKFVVDKANAIIWLLKELYQIELTMLTSSTVRLETGTSMHNSYQDVPDILRSMLAYFDFELPHIKKECTKEQ